MNTFVKIQLLTQFIDLFNYYPVKVNKLRYKNDSNEVTYVMYSNTKGTKNERGESMLQAPKQAVKFTEEQKYLKTLLELVSAKISERFLNFQSCFRFLDVNHTQSITLNEFAQAMEHMRIKLSFDDIKLLFRYLDTNKRGEIGYPEFTMLLEEKWRGLDAFKAVQTKSIYDNDKNDQEALIKLEKLATITSKLKLKKGRFALPANINRQDASDFMEMAREMQAEGKETGGEDIMRQVMKHEYL